MHKVIRRRKKRSSSVGSSRGRKGGAILQPVNRDQQNQVHQILHPTSIQTKLKVGQPNDKYEREADRVADKVMGMPEPVLQRQPENEDEEVLQTKLPAAQITSLVQRQEAPSKEEAEPVQAKSADELQRQPIEEELQAKEVAGLTPLAPSNTESRLNSLKSGGHPLDSATRNFFEPRFGHDFSKVKIHTDNHASETARSINARAFTVGNHVVMGAGEYQPGSPSGQRLLGHELTHVVQQQKARVPNFSNRNTNNTVRRNRGFKQAIQVSEPHVQRNVLRGRDLPVIAPFTASQTSTFTRLVQTYLTTRNQEDGRAVVTAVALALEDAGVVHYNRRDVDSHSPQFRRRPSIAASESSGSNHDEAGYTFAFNGKIKVEIYPHAFIGSDAHNSLGFLTGVIIHEYIHVLQNLSGPQGSDAQREFQAWLWQAEHIAQLGITPGTEGSRQISGLLRRYYRQLPAPEKRRFRRRFNNAVDAL